MADMKVNLFIVGAAKCGTTYLAAYLSQHSAINMAAKKEPDYFSHEVLKDKVTYYNTAPVTRLSDYHALFDLSRPCSYYGEASVSYLPYQAVAQKIHAYNPEAKIIILLRNPADRAYSHYKMDKRLGFVKEEFEPLLLKQLNTPFADEYYHQYVELGFYHQQVQNYLNIFGPQQVCCIDTSSGLDAALAEVLSFLKIPQEDISQEKANEAITFNSPLLRKLYAVPLARKILKKITPASLLKRLRKEETSMADSTRSILEALYKEDQKKLKSLLTHA
jgi:hypothetical protein